jgi:hypothetical protein
MPNTSLFDRLRAVRWTQRACDIAFITAVLIASFTFACATWVLS